MIRKLILATLAAAIAPSFARAEDKPFDDTAFMTTVVIGGLYDVRLSDLVGSQSRNEDVRQFAADIVADHLLAAEKVKSTAKDAGIELPAKLDDLHQKQFESFKDYKGEDLNRDYLKVMIQRQTIGVALFTQASKEAKNPAIREFAAKTLPKLQKHLEAAKKLDKNR